MTPMHQPAAYARTPAEEAARYPAPAPTPGGGHYGHYDRATPMAAPTPQAYTPAVPPAAAAPTPQMYNAPTPAVAPTPAGGAAPTPAAAPTPGLPAGMTPQQDYGPGPTPGEHHAGGLHAPTPGYAPAPTPGSMPTATPGFHPAAPALTPSFTPAFHPAGTPAFEPPGQQLPLPPALTPEQQLQQWVGVLVRLPEDEGPAEGHVLAVQPGGSYLSVQPGRMDGTGKFLAEGEASDYMASDLQLVAPQKKERVRLVGGHARAGAVGAVVSIDQGEYVVKIDGESGLQIVERSQCARLVVQ
jgi:hypothetical protein